MTMAMSIPTVTTEDLLHFHTKHFGRTFAGVQPGFASNNDHHAEEFYQEDGLGYYPDGTERTLTDEQISIFRHSEIQRLLLKQRREDEAAADARADVESSPATDGESPPTLKPESQPHQNSSCDHSTDEGEIDQDEGEDDEEEDAEYAKFLAQERQQFAIDAEKKRNQIRKKQQKKDAHDRSLSTRRRVRELDDNIKQDDVVLDY